MALEIADDLRDEDITYKRYEGDTKNGFPHGTGRMDFVDNSVYEGAFLNGLRHGVGEIFDTKGNHIFKGEWNDDIPHGQCERMVLPDGTVFRGQLKDGRRAGFGVLQDQNGNFLYDGQWENDLPHGRGTFTCEDGVYEGEFKEGFRCGKGRFVYDKVPNPNGAPREYVGDFIHDVPHGLGTYTDETGVSAVVRFENGKITADSKRAYSGMCGGGGLSDEAPKGVSATGIKTFPADHWGKKRRFTETPVHPDRTSSSIDWTRE
eukprot:Polyplicarium_translucidae@DN2387_c0_g1_i2.p2